MIIQTCRCGGRVIREPGSSCDNDYQCQACGALFQAAPDLYCIKTGKGNPPVSIGWCAVQSHKIAIEDVRIEPMTKNEQRLTMAIRRLLGTKECDRITDGNELECGWCGEIYDGAYGTWHKSEACPGQIARTTILEIEGE